MKQGWCLLLAGVAPLFAAVEERGPLVMDSVAGAQFAFEGVLQDRIENNVEQWLLRAPAANPGMLEMFRARDREPVPQIVPWAGEFAGKYLISAIQTLRMAESKPLRAEVERVIAELIASQAEDGYLGPFPRATRLKANWDLWGHYHCLQAMVMWHEAIGDAAALACARRAADLVCRTFLDGSLRVRDAGSHEMNMAVIHVLGHLHRITGEARYLAMMRAIEQDWETAGDYLRAGLDGREFFQSPLPRWESLHDLQGLVELYRITGDEKYRRAFTHHWRSIARNDIHNTGGFSSGEQATGNPYASGAIETCCTVAWMALSVDHLRLTGESVAADFLELATFNGGVGAQHPSGRWWTYNTPMEGVREASAHTIVFQSRAGTPELNCCSVNAPRVLGVLSEWAVTQAGGDVVLNHFGPATYQLPQAGLVVEGNYPLGGPVRVKVRPGQAKQFGLRLRMPGWSRKTVVRLNGQEIQSAPEYLRLDRTWREGDMVELNFDWTVRAVAGDREAAGRVSLFRGPLLLAYDQTLNGFDETKLPPVQVARLPEAKATLATGGGVNGNWLRVTLPGEKELVLSDFATAGCRGTRYQTWLPAADAPPPAVIPRVPADGAEIGASSGWMRWMGPAAPGRQVDDYRLIIATSGGAGAPVIDVGGIRSNRFLLDEAMRAKLKTGAEYTWRVIARNHHGETDSAGPAARFKFRPAAPLSKQEAANGNPEGPGRLLLDAPLAGSTAPNFGKLDRETTITPAPGRGGQSNGAVELNGSQMIVYQFEEIPEEDYALAGWVRVLEFPKGRIAQVASAWTAGSDDPLRLVIDGERLHARIEAGSRGASTKGIPVENQRWHHVAVVKQSDTLRLYLDGVEAAKTGVPAQVFSQSRALALGGNPRYPGNEFLQARFAEFRFYARALGAEEIRALAR